MNTVLLTWNPGPNDDQNFTVEEWLEDMVVPHQNGATVEGTWSVANHVNGIAPGDVAFMYRQGDCGRGIVARGTVRSFPWEGEHWDASRAGETTNYVDVEWMEAVPVDLAIDVDELEDLVPDFKWRQVYSSGRVMPARQGDRLEKAWLMYVDTEYVQAYSALYASDVWRRVVDLELAVG